MKSLNKKKQIEIFVDFDGTITEMDSLQLVLDTFASKEWREIEDLVTSGILPEKKALQSEFLLLHEPPDKVLQFLQNHATIDPYFTDFVQFCEENHIPITILSGGFVPFIKTILQKYNLAHLPIHANNFHYENRTWNIIPNPGPKINNHCNHCKTYHLLRSKNQKNFVIYIGDGNTDRCPARNAHIVFAKNSLANYLDQEKRFYYKYENFADVIPILEELCYNWYALMTD